MNEFDDLLNKTGDFVVEFGDFFDAAPGQVNETGDLAREVGSFV